MSKRLGKICVISFLSCLICAILLSNCSDNSTGNEDDNDINLDPFKNLAQAEVCADYRNNLYLIDEHLVLWEREGDCPDNAYAQRLYGETPDDIKCLYSDSIGGPVYICNDSKYHEMFQTILTNLDGDNLGLTSEHTVKDISL